jgi:hypothetical protein
MALSSSVAGPTESRTRRNPLSPLDDWISDALNKAAAQDVMSKYKETVTAMAKMCKGMGWAAEETYLYFQSMTPPERYSHLPLISYWVGLAFKDRK